MSYKFPRSPEFIRDITFEGLKAFIADSKLTKGLFYRITDFRSVRQHAGIDTNDTPDVPTYTIGEVEPITVFAVSANEIGTEAFSDSHPKDIIHYSLAIPVEFSDDAMGLPVDSDDNEIVLTGTIIYREDPVANLSTGYDFRAVLNRRWNTKMVLLDEFEDPILGPTWPPVYLKRADGTLILTPPDPPIYRTDAAGNTIYSKTTGAIDFTVWPTNFRTTGNVLFGPDSTNYHTPPNSAATLLGGTTLGNSGVSSMFYTGIFTNLSFWWSVSCQINSDYFELYIDGSLFGQWTGSYGWQPFSINLAYGVHNVEWRYRKDASGSAGANRAWIDDISFDGEATEETTILDVTNPSNWNYLENAVWNSSENYWLIKDNADNASAYFDCFLDPWSFGFRPREAAITYTAIESPGFDLIPAINWIQVLSSGAWTGSAWQSNATGTLEMERNVFDINGYHFWTVVHDCVNPIDISIEWDGQLDNWTGVVSGQVIEFHSGTVTETGWTFKAVDPLGTQFSISSLLTTVQDPNNYVTLVIPLLGAALINGSGTPILQRGFASGVFYPVTNLANENLTNIQISVINGIEYHVTKIELRPDLTGYSPALDLTKGDPILDLTNGVKQYVPSFPPVYKELYRQNPSLETLDITGDPDVVSGWYAFEGGWSSQRKAWEDQDSGLTLMGTSFAVSTSNSFQGYTWITFESENPIATIEIFGMNSSDVNGTRIPIQTLYNVESGKSYPLNVLATLCTYIGMNFIDTVNRVQVYSMKLSTHDLAIIPLELPDLNCNGTHFSADESTLDYVPGIGWTAGPSDSTAYLYREAPVGTFNGYTMLTVTRSDTQSRFNIYINTGAGEVVFYDLYSGQTVRIPDWFTDADLRSIRIVDVDGNTGIAVTSVVFSNKFIPDFKDFPTFDATCNNIRVGAYQQSFTDSESATDYYPAINNVAFKYQTHNITFEPGVSWVDVEDGSENITIAAGSNNIVFDINNYQISIGANCNSLNFNWNCSDISIGSSNYEHSFANEVSQVKTGAGCQSLSFDTSTYNVTFGNGCSEIAIADYCYDISFRDECQSMSFGEGCYEINIGNDCNNSTFQTQVYGVELGSCSGGQFFGMYSYHINVGKDCADNTFGMNSYDITVGDSGSNNSFAQENKRITLGVGCDYNFFDAGCKNIVLGNNNDSNSFGVECATFTFGNGNDNNRFGDYCYNFTFAEKNTFMNFDDECDNITFGSDNYNIGMGFNCHEIDIASYCFGQYDNDDYTDFEDNCCRIKIGSSFGMGYGPNFSMGCNDIVIGDNCGITGEDDGRDNIIFGYECADITIGTNNYSTTFDDYCNNITLASTCSENYFGEGCYDIALGVECYGNSFQGEDINWNNAASSVVFGSGCRNNQIGPESNQITFGMNCRNNTTWDNVYDFTLGNNCSYNRVGYDINNNDLWGEGSNITLGNNCYENDFGYYCRNITIGSEAQQNTFGAYCENITMGIECGSYEMFNPVDGYWYIPGNIFDDYCSEITMGNNCNSNKFEHHCINITLGNTVGAFAHRGGWYQDDDDNWVADETYYEGNEFIYTCQRIQVGDFSAGNFFGEGCLDVTFGENCKDNNLEAEYGECADIRFGKNCNNNSLNGTCSTVTFGDGCSNNEFNDDGNITFGSYTSDRVTTDLFPKDNYGSPRYNGTNMYLYTADEYFKNVCWDVEDAVCGNAIYIANNDFGDYAQQDVTINLAPIDISTGAKVTVKNGFNEGYSVTLPGVDYQDNSLIDGGDDIVLTDGESVMLYNDGIVWRVMSRTGGSGGAAPTGPSGTFTTSDGKEVTFVNGVITSIVTPMYNLDLTNSAVDLFNESLGTTGTLNNGGAGGVWDVTTSLVKLTKNSPAIYCVNPKTAIYEIAITSAANLATALNWVYLGTSYDQAGTEVVYAGTYAADGYNAFTVVSTGVNEWLLTIDASKINNPMFNYLTFFQLNFLANIHVIINSIKTSRNPADTVAVPAMVTMTIDPVDPATPGLVITVDGVTKAPGTYQIASGEHTFAWTGSYPADTLYNPGYVRLSNQNIEFASTSIDRPDTPSLTATVTTDFTLLAFIGYD